MSKDSDFLDDLKGFKDNEETGLMPAVVKIIASATNLVQEYDVLVFKKFRGGFKVQWAKKGSRGMKPELPKLKPGVMAELKKNICNSNTVLTSGYDNAEGSNNPGMRTPEDVLRFFKILADNGVLVNYSV
jgi:hypothetical protein